MNSRNTAIAVIGVFVLAAMAMCVVSDDSDAAGVSIENVMYNEEMDRFEIVFSKVLKGYWTFDVYLDDAHVAYTEGYDIGVSKVGLHPYDGVTVMQGETYRVVAASSGTSVGFTYTYETVEVNTSVSGNGVVQGPGEFVSGSSVTLTATPDTGYVFAGWYDGDRLLSQDREYTFWAQDDVTYTAVFKLQEFTVTFNTDGGSSVDAQKVEYGKTVSKPSVDPTKTGYTFAGWFSDFEPTTSFDFTTPIFEDTTIYAKWTINQYTVTFNTNGGSTVNSVKVDYNNTASKPSDPTKAGYTFAGWYSDSGLTTAFDFTTPIVDDITLYAKWNAVTPDPGPSPGPSPGPTPGPEPTVPVVPDKGDGTYPYGDGSMTITTSTDGSKTVEINLPVKNGTETEVQNFDKGGKYLGSVVTTETNEKVSGNTVAIKVVEIRDDSADMTSRTTESVAVSSDGSAVTTIRTVEDPKGIVSSESETTILAGDDGMITEKSVQDVLAILNGYTSKETEKIVNLFAKERKGEVSTLLVPGDSMKALAGTGAEIMIGTESMVIDLDDLVVYNLAGKEGDISLSIGEADKTKLKPNQLKRVGDAPVFTIDLKVGDEEIHQLGGKASVTLPYELKAGQNSKNVKVYYVDDDGKLTQMVTKYDAATKSVTFETNHFSIYMIGDESSMVDPAEDDDGDEGGLNMALVAGIVVVVVVVLVVAVVAITRKH